MPSDDFFIRRFAKARDAGDDARAREIWEDACVRQYDFVRVRVRVHRFPGGSGLSAEDRQDAEIEAMTRIIQMGDNFRGTTAAEFRAAIMRACYFACMDVGRQVLAYEENIGGSLDDRFEDSDAGRFDSFVDQHLRDQLEQSNRTADVMAETERMEALIASAIPFVKNEKHRAVLELTYMEKLPGDEIAERLDITAQNVYKRRERGIKALKEILDDNRP